MIVTGLLFILYIKTKLPQNQLNRVKVKVRDRKSSEWERKAIQWDREGRDRRGTGRNGVRRPQPCTVHKGEKAFEFLLQDPSDPAHVKKYNI